MSAWSTGMGINALFVRLVAHVKRFEAYLGQFFADSDEFVCFTSRLGVQITQTGNFRADNNRHTNQLLYSLWMRMG